MMKKQFLCLALILTTAYASSVSASNNNLQEENQGEKSTKLIFVSEEEINDGDKKDKKIVEIDSRFEKDVTITVFKPFCSKSQDLYDGCMNSGFLFKEELITPKILFWNVKGEKRKKLIEGQESDLLKLSNNLLGSVICSLDVESLLELRKTCKFFAHFITSPNPWNFTDVSWEDTEKKSPHKSFIKSYKELGMISVSSLNPFFYFQITSLLPTSSIIAVEECFEDFYIGFQKMNIGPRTQLKREKLTFEKNQETQTTLSLKIRENPLSLVSCELTPYATIVCGARKPEYFLRKITVNYGDKTLTITPSEFKSTHNTLPRMLILEELEGELSLKDFGSLSLQQKSDFFHRIYSQKSEFLKKWIEKN